LHSDLIGIGWATTQFAEALAWAGEPGPNGVVVVLGFMTGGGIGAALALVAVTLPPLLVLAVQRGFRQFGPHPLTRGFLAGLALAIAGVGVVTLGRIVGQQGFDARAGALVVFGAVMAWRKVPVLLIVILAALAGIALGA
jgi:chromate transport protein ChrA